MRAWQSRRLLDALDEADVWTVSLDVITDRRERVTPLGQTLRSDREHYLLEAGDLRVHLGAQLMAAVAHYWPQRLDWGDLEPVSA